RLKSWFATRANKIKSGRSEPWAAFINNFTGDHGPPPRHVPDFKVYEGQAEFKSKIDAEAKKRLSDMQDDRDLAISTHVTVARELFEKEDKNIKDSVHVAADTLYNSRLTEWEDKGKKILDPTMVKELRSQMSAKVQPLVDALAAVTKTRISFVAMGYDDEGNEDAAFCANVLSGSTPGSNPQQFHEWDPFGYRNLHIRPFADFVKSCSRLEKGYPASPPQYPPEIQAAFAIPVLNADISAPTVEPNVAASTSTGLAVTATMSTSSSSRKRPRKDSNGDETPHTTTPELSSDDDNNIPKEDSVDFGPCSIKLPKGRRMGQYLAAELKQMAEKERTMKMLAYSSYSQTELDRADYRAKMRLVDDWMGDNSQ
ncbi:hypothetical protein MPER_03046, partial [Moniliophthora perniciosa FA553]